MNRKLQIVNGLSLALMALPIFAAEPVLTKDAEGKLLFDARWRMEQVDDDAFAKDANADTLRLRLGYCTPVRSGWSGVVELEHTSHLFNAWNRKVRMCLI